MLVLKGPEFNPTSTAVGGGCPLMVGSSATTFAIPATRAATGAPGTGQQPTQIVPPVSTVPPVGQVAGSPGLDLIAEDEVAARNRRGAKCIADWSTRTAVGAAQRVEPG